MPVFVLELSHDHGSELLGALLRGRRVLEDGGLGGAPLAEAQGHYRGLVEAYAIVGGRGDDLQGAHAALDRLWAEHGAAVRELLEEEDSETAPAASV
jgi:hypothetical protein